MISIPSFGPLGSGNNTITFNPTASVGGIASVNHSGLHVTMTTSSQPPILSKLSGKTVAILLLALLDAVADMYVVIDVYPSLDYGVGSHFTVECTMMRYIGVLVEENSLVIMYGRNMKSVSLHGCEMSSSIRGAILELLT